MKYFSSIFLFEFQHALCIMVNGGAIFRQNTQNYVQKGPPKISQAQNIRSKCDILLYLCVKVDKNLA